MPSRPRSMVSGMTAVAALLLLLLVVSCSAGAAKRDGVAPASGAGHAATGVGLFKTEAEKHFGLTPRTSKDVIYQDDVILLPDGPEAIVSVTNSGASVVLKADAEGVEDLAKGKVLFATGRVVGRVAGIRKTAAGTEVALLPVSLTDVVSKADLTWEQPVDPSSMVVFTGQNLGGASTDSQNLPDVPSGSKVVETEPAAYHPVAAGTTTTTSSVPASGGVNGSGGANTGSVGSSDGEPGNEAGSGDSQGSGPSNGFLDEPAGPGGAAPGGGSTDGEAGEPGGGSAETGSSLGPSVPFPGNPVDISGFRITPIGSGGVGVKLDYDKNGTKFLASVKLKLRSPTVHAGLVIDHGVLRSASLSLAGAAGVEARFEAGTENGINGNIHKYVDVPIDITIPLGGAFPLSMTWRQTFILDTTFSARHGTLSAKGDYSFSGGLGFKYRSGFFSVNAPSDARADTSMVENLDGVSVGVSGLVLAYRARVIVGFGAFGFTSGLEMTTTASWGVSKASNIGGIPCRRVDITLDGTAGVGWSIPRPLAAAINLFLRLFDAQIPSSGGVRSDPVTIAKGTGILPDVSGCGGGDGTSS